MELPARVLQAPKASGHHRQLLEIEVRLRVDDVLDEVVVLAVELVDLLVTDLVAVLDREVAAVREDRVDVRATRVVDLVDRDALDVDLIQELESVDGPLVGYVVEALTGVSGEVVLDGLPPVDRPLGSSVSA